MKTFYIFKSRNKYYMNLDDGKSESGADASDLARASHFDSIQDAFYALARFNFERGSERGRGYMPNAGCKNVGLFKVTSTPVEPRIVRRVLKDCEGCNADEVVKFAIWLVGLPHCNLSGCTLYDSCEGALEGIAHRKIYHRSENLIPIRIGLTTIAGTETLTETEVA